MSGLAIIIPCLNEEAQLPATLSGIAQAAPSSEVFVVDGGSEDRSAALAGENGCTVIASDRRQRAHQLNLGAQAAMDAGAETLLFLHADTRIENRSIDHLLEALGDAEVIGGGFFRRFDSPSAYLRWSTWVADLRARFWNIFYGDQAIFARRTTFEQLDGYDESLDLAEDLDFSLRMRAAGKVVALGPHVTASARRFEELGPREQVRRDRAFVKRWMRERGWSDWRRGRKP